MFSTFSSSHSLFFPAFPLAMALNASLQSASISQKLLPAVCCVPPHTHPPLIWQAWNIEENVNKCFLVTCQVYEIHLYWWMLCQGVDSGCMWSCGDLFYAESILFRSVNVVSVCVWNSKDRKTGPEFMCLFSSELQSTCVQVHAPNVWAPTVSSRVWLESFEKGKLFAQTSISTCWVDKIHIREAGNQQ